MKQAIKKTTTLLIFNLFTLLSVGQVNTDSLVGNYINKQEIGGGFIGGPNGECYTTYPDGIITNTINIDSNLVVCKISDTINYRGVMETTVDWGCDTLYLGTAEIIEDSLIVTYTKEPICPNLFRLINTTEEEEEIYQELSYPIIEKYYIRIVEDMIYGLRIWNDGYDLYERE